MDDLISRQAAIDEIKNFKNSAAEWRDEQEDRSDIWHRADSAVASAIEIGLRIKKLPSAPRWTPVTEGLPEEPFGCVVSYHGFMLTPHGEIEYDAIYPELLGYDGGGWNNSEGECVDNMIDVTAWMPSPEPWKG